MIKKIASRENEIELQVYEQLAVLGGDCSDWCPVSNNESQGNCCRFGKGGLASYLANYSS